MSFAKSESVSITTAGDGSATAYSSPVTGGVVKIMYGGQFDATLDVTITTETSAQNLWVETDVAKAATFRCPRDPTHSTLGVASLYAGAGEPVEGIILAADERIKFVLAQGGATVTGTFKVLIG